MIRRILRLRPGARVSTGLDIREGIAEGVFDKLGLLRASELFHDLNDEQMTDVEKMTVMTSCKRGNLI